MDTIWNAALQKLAARENTTPEAICESIQTAIDAGFGNPDPEIQAAWKQIPFGGGHPTPEDVFTYCLLRTMLNGDFC